jgi:hypothetical protein
MSFGYCEEAMERNGKEKEEVQEPLYMYVTV